MISRATLATQLRRKPRGAFNVVGLGVCGHGRHAIGVEAATDPELVGQLFHCGPNCQGPIEPCAIDARETVNARKESK